MADILSLLVNKFSRKITVDVSPKRFVFSDGHRTITLETYLYLGPNSKGSYSILAISEHVQEANCLRVDLFDPKSVLPETVLRFSCLQEFLRFGFAKLSNRRAMLRPSIIFRGANSLAYITCGYERKILSDAAANAGAQSVEFLG